MDSDENLGLVYVICGNENLFFLLKGKLGWFLGVSILLLLYI